MTHLGILTASARPQRVGGHVARWVADAAAERFALDRIDLGALGLPAFDEPHSPREGRPPVHEHTRAWARRVEALDAAVFVTPQYNGSYPGALKNAVDFLYAPWNGLPVLVVAYGWGGGQEVISQLVPLLGRVEADVVDAIGLGFREDLSVHGELSVRGEAESALHRALEDLARRAALRRAPAEIVEC